MDNDGQGMKTPSAIKALTFIPILGTSGLVLGPFRTKSGGKIINYGVYLRGKVSKNSRMINRLEKLIYKVQKHHPQYNPYFNAHLRYFWARFGSVYDQIWW